MASFDRVKSLQAKHAQLESLLDRERTRPEPDAVMVRNLKREKLRIKDEIARMA
ncbi:YdcH family protein [Elstera cyanobacteriorum]|uniref:DUF465 domain-containing protein n=1 Tax=Elstera cyanobacteriorum TaxID=2022747 RepID=A0A255XV66_9PROT|nr:YdcH family protein [Elstera cyanobacteriorum]MCK6443983.1 YdcH family protein [Elstera cyanobacteriorum]OYQ20802.1 hypothetical protein CHR90_03905 [Elstera cyanobacteriorum]GFZ98412.1 hypothetical protein GCM10011497_31190 [Elstera cyanobacteriorum]